MTISKELLDELLKGCERPEDLLGDAGLMKELKIKLMERMLGAELIAHLGYEDGKDAPPDQANRRNGSSAKRLKGQEGIEIAIPPPKNAMLSPDAARNPTISDRQITEIKAYGRIAWQKTSGYNQRSRGETLMGRWKAVIGPKLKARSFENQKTEARIGVRVLNRMTELSRPSFERTA